MRIFLVLLFLTFAAKAQAPLIRVEAATDLDRMFERSSGWTGADGAYSVPLSNGKILWLFSDTWIGNVENGQHRDSSIIDNSIGIQTGKSVDFHFNNSDVKPQPFFPGAVWIYAGIENHRKLSLFLQQVDRDPNDGFRHVGTRLATIENPLDDPRLWKTAVRQLPFGEFKQEGDSIFGSAILDTRKFTYVYGTKETVRDGFHHKNMIVARVRSGRLDDFNSWRFFDGKSWNRDWHGAVGIADRFANEFSVSFSNLLGKYVAVHTLDGISPEIVIRTSPNPEGPWSGPIRVFDCPEAKWGARIICYAAKGHPELSDDGGILISYIASSNDFWQIATDSRLYRPRFLRVVFGKKNAAVS